MGRGRPVRRTPSASPSEWAGSVETTSTRRPLSARASAAAAARVVLPAPPFPPKKRTRTSAAPPAPRLRGRGARGAAGGLLAFLSLEGDLRPRHLEGAGGRRPTPAPVPDLGDAPEELGLDAPEFRLVDLAHLEPHLGREELLAQRGVVVHLGLHRGGELLEDEAQAADEERIEDDHLARSSLRRMLTKL